jgi:tetratricopeptide (TPR) repeat protein
MNESDYIAELSSLWPNESETSKEALALADTAVRMFPDSAKLWCMRGDLIQLGPADIHYGLEEALACYERAVSIDPQFAEGYEEIGHFFDAVMPNPKRARRAFGQAASIRAAQNP